ncbi:hypothetical protein SH528x_005067 [Novipirellula sp. SH528]|uniref:hypothetical protein n=1 Tax=Novipirellula sp. SH528 TaxID=3454466 RepID=UPI003F9FD305
MQAESSRDSDTDPAGRKIRVNSSPLLMLELGYAVCRPKIVARLSKPLACITFVRRGESNVGRVNPR